MTVEHVNLTGTQLHEPKGVDAPAGVGTLAFASSGATSWGNFVVGASATASNSSELTFTNLAGYGMVKLTIVDLLRATASSTLRLQLSTDNGSNYLTSIYDTLYYDTAVSISLRSNSSSWDICGAQTQLYTNGVIYLFNLNSTTVETSGHGTIVESTSAGGVGTPLISNFNINVNLGTLDAHNAIRIFSSSGNLTSGSVYLEGFKGS